MTTTTKTKKQAKKQQAKSIVNDAPAPFSAQRAAISFGGEFNAWLNEVAVSDSIETVLHAGLLCRAIMANVVAYLDETVGMDDRDAKDHFQDIIDGNSEDRGHRVYGVLGIEPAPKR